MSGPGGGTGAAGGTLLADPARRLRRVALVGNPNVGKSSIFNALTGLHQRVSNYPGITVERRTGLAGTPAGPVEVIDLPGAYALAPRSPEEAIVRDELRGAVEGDPAPDLVVLVLDATNLSRNLFLASQVLDTGLPAVVALNQVDAAEEEGIRVDAAALSRLLGVPVVPTVGRTGRGMDDLRRAIAAGGSRGTLPPPAWRTEVEAAAAVLATPLAFHFGGREEARRLLPEILGSEGLARELLGAIPPDLRARVEVERGRVAAKGIDPATASAEARYRTVDAVGAETVRRRGETLGWRDRLDRVLTHRVLGTAVLVLVFTLIFQAIFAWSTPLMDAVDGLFAALGGAAGSALPAGLPRDFVVDGLFQGLSGILVFVPQIAVLFLLIEVLEDSGYLARAAFLLDRLMGKAGLPGRAFLPLVSSIACAIPGIMATRTIENAKDRMATIFVAPFMSCSARLPVYAMVIGALFSRGKVLGFLATGTVVMLAMYLLGILVGFATAKLLRRTVLRGGRSPLLLELPAYHLPSPRTLGLNVARRTWAFVSGAGPIILGISVVLWVLAAFPRDVPYGRDYAALRAAAARTAEAAPADARERVLAEETARVDALQTAERREKSYAGRLGKAIEPAIRPLGFDWKMGIGILASFAAREVFVGTMGVVYAAGSDDPDGVRLREAMMRDRYPDTGEPVFTPLVGISLLVFFVLAMQCMSTLAIVRRETGSWKWPLAMLAWMTALAYLGSLAVYQGGRALGF